MGLSHSSQEAGIPTKANGIDPSREIRQAVIKEAITWLRTPFVDQQHVKGSGADCGMMPLSVYSAVGLLKWFEPGHYSVQVHLHKTAEEQRQMGQKPYVDFVREHLRQIEEKDVGPGDFVLFWYGKCFSHGAIVIDWPRKIIHAVAGIGVTYDDPSHNGRMRYKKREFYSPFPSEAL